MNWPLTKSPLETCIIPRILIRAEMARIEGGETDNIHEAHCVAQRIGDMAYDAVSKEFPAPYPAIVYSAVYRAVYEEIVHG